MALSYGFYNSVEGDRKYDAVQLGRIFDGIITDGIYATYEKGMVVKASDSPGEVVIQPGRAWFNHTWSFNDADYIMEAPAPEVLLDRIDALVLDVNTENAFRENKFMWVQGEPSSVPQNPTLIRSVTHNQYPLCYVHRYPETTMIYTRDITNAIGTSECPFVTGVLEGIDIDAWIQQWDDEFHTWERDTVTSFETWEETTRTSFESWVLNQETTYTAWWNALKDQAAGDVQDIEDWIATIQDIIDSETATHLQSEIDALAAMLPTGSHITITTTNSDLYNRNVTVSDGTHPVTTRFDTSGVAVVESYPYVGNLSITSSDGVETTTRILEVPYFARYSKVFELWKAPVNIQGDENLYGHQVVITNSSDVEITRVTLDPLTGEATWDATEADTYTFTFTYGGEDMSETLVITEETTYTVDLTTFRATVNIVSDDGLAGYTLTVRDSNDVAVKSIVLDSNGSGTFVAKKADTYSFEVIFHQRGIIDYLTISNEGTYRLRIEEHGGTVTPVNDVPIWLECAGIFDKNYTLLSEVLSDYATLLALISDENAVAYMVRSTDFANGICANQTAMTYIGANDDCVEILLANDTWCNAICNSSYYANILTIQIPTMTSDTTPSGLAYFDTNKSHGAYNYPYTLFDKGTSSIIYNGFLPIADNAVAYYKFTSSVNIRKVRINIGKDSTFGFSPNYKIRASNDGTNWTDLTNKITITPSSLPNIDNWFNFILTENNSNYLYYGIISSNCFGGDRNYCLFKEIEMYGRE